MTLTDFKTSSFRLRQNNSNNFLQKRCGLLHGETNNVIKEKIRAGTGEVEWWNTEEFDAQM
jgi:hypothetical protein